MSSSSSSSSARATASISANEAEIRDLKAKRDRVESKRDLVENLLKVKEPQRPKFFENNPDYVGLESFTTAELKEKEKLLTQEISELSAEILSLRTPPGITIDDLRKAIKQAVDPVHDETRAVRKGMDAALASLLDPWENIRSIHTEAIVKESAEHLGDVSSYYGTPRKQYCMVLGKVTHCNIICAHIWPNYTNGNGLESFNLRRDDVNSARNFLRLHKDIEKAFDHKRLYFEQSDSTVADKLVLRVRVLDPVLKETTFKVSGGEVKFSSIDGQDFDWKFSNEKLPYRRLLALHALKAIDKAKSLNWITDEADSVSRRQRNIELARLSLGDNRPVLDAFFFRTTSL